MISEELKAAKNLLPEILEAHINKLQFAFKRHKKIDVIAISSKKMVWGRELLEDIKEKAGLRLEVISQDEKGYTVLWFALVGSGQ